MGAGRYPAVLSFARISRSSGLKTVRSVFTAT